MLPTAVSTPTPFPDYTGDPNLITPGVVGFIITFLVAAATVLLLLDMTRRIRRSRYREEIRQKLEAEAAEAAGEPRTGAAPKGPAAD
nr:hypothetical protein [Galbitalea soli]